VRQTVFTKALEQVIAEDLRALDEVIKEDIEALADIGSPEKLIGKKYEEWTQQDKQMLAQVYGTGDESRLSKLIFKREYEKVLELEKEE